MPREDVELLQVGVGEGEHLRQEGVKPHVVGQLAAEVVLLLLGKSLEAIDDGREHRVELVLRRFRSRSRPGEAVDVGVGVDGKRGELRLNVVEQVRIGRLGEERRLVVGLEGVLDLVGLVGEVEHHACPSSRGACG